MRPFVQVFLKIVPTLILGLMVAVPGLFGKDPDPVRDGIPEDILIDQQSVWEQSNRILRQIGLTVQHPDALSGNRTIILQEGEGHEALIEQVGSNSAIIQQGNGVPGNNDGNRLQLSQSGTDNSSIVFQSGSGNRFLQRVQGDNNQISVFQGAANPRGDGRINTMEMHERNSRGMPDAGDENVVEQEITGSDNRIMLLQSGQGNVITQDVTGNRMEYVIEQVGDWNTIRHSEDGTSLNKGLRIYQNATGMDIKIQQGTFNNLKE